MATFDISTPTGSEAISSGDDRIREFKEAIQDALRGDETEGTEAIFPGSAPSTAPVYRYRGKRGSTAARPAAGQGGLYFDTSRNVWQRDSGSAWEDQATNVPAGTVMLFIQASAPVGWTKLTTQNDKALRIVSGSTGGSAGGSLGLSGGVSHTHEVASHDHAIQGAAVAHKHETTTVENSTGQLAVIGGTLGNAATNGAASHTFGGTGNLNNDFNYQLTAGMTDFAGGDTDGTALTTDTTAPVIAYLDCIQASKD